MVILLIKYCATSGVIYAFSAGDSSLGCALGLQNHAVKNRSKPNHEESSTFLNRNWWVRENHIVRAPERPIDDISDQKRSKIP